MAKSFWKRRRNDFLYILIAALFYLVRLVPRKVGLPLFAFLGWIVSLFPTRDKKRMYTHLHFIYGETWSTTKIQKMITRIYVTLGKNMFDALYFAYCSVSKFNTIVEYEGIKTIIEENCKGQGFVTIGGHIGCFEMPVHMFANNGVKSVTIGQQLYDPRVDKLIQHFRSGNNAKEIVYLHRDGAGRSLIKYLRKGYGLGILLDQDTKIEGVFARFLGKLAYTPDGPVRIAMKFKFPLYCVAVARQKNNKHTAQFKKIELENTGDFDRDLVFNVQKVNDFLSDAIRKNPEQWVWMHRRWNRKPIQPQYKDVPNIEKYE
jgi:KDO2-lipid IV(A) lauroyltransferase